MGLVYTQIIDKIDDQFYKLIEKYTKVPPHLQAQASARIELYKKVLAEGGHCPYTEQFIPPPDSQGVK